MSKAGKKKKRIGKANPLLYAIVYTVLKWKYTRKYRIKFDKSAIKGIKGPAIVVATHTCDEDHILSALTLYPIRPTYIVSEHFMHKKSTARLLKLMHVITKKMFTPDVSTIINIMRAKNEKAVIVIFPEGRLSCYGHTLPVAEGTAELIKKLGVDLYAWKAEGAYLSFPKWRDKGDGRIGEINASVKLLLSADEVASRDVSEIKRITEEAILHDDELAMQGVEYKCPDLARGVDKILYKCPKCMNEGRLTAGENHIRCECGLDAELNSRYRLSGAPFTRINEWFEWQQNSIDTDTERLESNAKFGCCREDGFMDGDAGEGKIYLDKDIFKLSGTLHGEPIEFSVSPEKIGAFPITPADHFDIYHNGRLLYVYPEPDRRMTVKWVSFLDNLMEKKRASKINTTTV
ncbi:MAG: 1-acyl-sn-glycerol-3-phosphate acyltransferase [Clostridia bacterium]|nr:1-acyl-sn-glycerol-3-phosphate acyltransferase [Clostridia bacterium]